eukprot:jgi/Ulvmu1/8624/UM046_0025.1
MGWEVGDLVWGSIKGYPKWPGQIMDPQSALQKVRARGKSGQSLVSFFGDNSYSWLDSYAISAFEKNLERLSVPDKKKLSASLAHRFERALEEACELRARRAGETPATAHEPLDFRTEAVVYDPTIIPDTDFAFEDLFPQVSAGEGASFDAAAGVALLRAAAKDPTSVRLPLLEAAAEPGDAAAEAAAERYREIKLAERVAIWRRFYKAPKAVQRQMCKHAMVSALARRKSAPEARPSAASNGAEELTPVPKKRGRTKSEGGGASGKAAKAARTGGRPRASGKGRMAKGKGAEKGLSVAAARAVMRGVDDGSGSSGEDADKRGQAGRRSDVSGAGGGSSALSEGVHLSAGDGGDSADDNVPLKKRAAFAAVERAQEEALRPPAAGSRGSGRGGRGRGRSRGRGGGRRGAVVKEEVKKGEADAAAASERELAMWAQALELAPWPEELPVEVVASEADMVTLIPRSLPVYDNIEPAAAAACIRLTPAKIRVRKLLVRVRQLARNTHITNSYDTILNPQNTAALFKIAEATRVRPPEAEAVASQVTRDALVAAWVDSRTAEYTDSQKRIDAWSKAQARGDLNPEDTRPPPEAPLPPERPESLLGKFDPPRALCIAPAVSVPLHTLRSLPLFEAQHEAALLDALRGFWRRRGCVLPLLMESCMLLDTAELLRLVAMRGGFWGACAAQGDGATVHKNEGATAWRVMATACWVTPTAAPDIPQLAARLQAHYLTWILPFEQELLREHAAQTATMVLPAVLLRRLALNRTEDSVLRAVVKYLGTLAEPDESGAPGMHAGRHGIAGEDALEIVSDALFSHSFAPSEVTPLLAGLDGFRAGPRACAADADDESLSVLATILPESSAPPPPHSAAAVAAAAEVDVKGQKRKGERRTAATARATVVAAVAEEDEATGSGGANEAASDGDAEREEEEEAAGPRWNRSGRGQRGGKAGRGRRVKKKATKVEEAIRGQKQAQARSGARNPRATFLDSLNDVAAPDLSALPAPRGRGRAGAGSKDGQHPEKGQPEKAAAGESGDRDGGAGGRGGAAAAAAGTSEDGGGGAAVGYQNPFKRRPVARAAGDADKQQAGNEKPHAVKVQFDSRWVIPTVSRVEEVAKERFKLTTSRTTSLAPTAKFHVLYFDSLATAHAAARELPGRLRAREQWPSDAECTATVLTMREAHEIVTAAANQRRGGGGAAAGPQRGAYAAPWPPGGSTAAAAPAASAAYAAPAAAPRPPPPPPPPVMPAFVLPPGAQPGTVLQPAPPAMAAPPPDMVAAPAPVYAGGAPPAVAVAPAASAAAAAAPGDAGLPNLDINSLGAILQQAGGDAAAGAANSAAKDEQEQQMLGLLTQLGHAGPAAGEN